MIYIIKLCVIIVLATTFALFLTVRNRILVRLEKDHIDTYKKLFVTLENKGSEVEETFLWCDFTAEGYKKLKDEYLSRFMRHHNALGLALVILFVLLLVVLGIERAQHVKVLKGGS